MLFKLTDEIGACFRLANAKKGDKGLARYKDMISYDTKTLAVTDKDIFLVNQLKEENLWLLCTLQNVYSLVTLHWILLKFEEVLLPGPKILHDKNFQRR